MRVVGFIYFFLERGAGVVTQSRLGMQRRPLFEVRARAGLSAGAEPR